MNRMSKYFLASIIAILFIAHGSILWAGPASTYVEILDPAYRDIERLVSWRLIDPPMIDQRPLTRGEFARMTAEAMKNFERESGGFFNDEVDYKIFSRRLALHSYKAQVIERLKMRFQGELEDIGAIDANVPFVRGVALDEFIVDNTYLSEAPLVLPYDNGLATISAKVNPLFDYREGRHAVDGFQSAVETTHRIRVSKYFAAMAHPRLEGNTWRTNFGEDDIELLLQEGYGMLQVGDFALEFGRASTVWGPGERGGLMLTNNARPLDQINISTPSPFRLPWVFRHLGRWRMTLFGANLGPQYVRKYAWLTGYRLSYMPVRYLELGFGNVTMMGGEGSPYMSAFDIFAEFWGVRAAGTSGSDVNMTDHMMEATVLVRIPPLAGLTLYGILENDDKRDTIKRFLRDGSSYLAGFYLPRMDRLGKSDFRFEFKRMCAIQYRHGLYADGFTLDNLLIGDDLGPDALGIHTRYSREISEGLTFAASFDWDLRRSDMHTTTVDPDGSLGDTIVTQSLPHDTRYRFIFEPVIRINPNLHAIVYAGYERALNANFVEGVSRNNWLLALSLRFNFDKYFRFQSR